tara:strand:- start:892 stop:1356 length:465 start_codon:yes stop_codon:yes gene_type:complete
MSERAASRGERGPLRLSRSRRLTLYVTFAGVWITGVLWLIYHYFLQTEGPFGFQNNPLEKTWLQFHAAFSFVAIGLFGMLWAIHIVRGWNMNWRRWSGGTMVGVMVVLTISGYALYYVESQELDDITSVVHWSVGLAALGVFLIHWLSKSRPST